MDYQGDPNNPQFDDEDDDEDNDDGDSEEKPVKENLKARKARKALEEFDEDVDYMDDVDWFICICFKFHMYKFLSKSIVCFLFFKVRFFWILHEERFIRSGIKLFELIITTIVKFYD